MKRIISTLTGALLALSLASTALAAPPQTAPGKNPLTCFGSPCTSNGKTATFSTGAGVYLLGYNSSFYGVRTGLITTLSNTYTTVSGGGGADPYWTIPIDDTTYNVDGDGDGIIGDGYTDYFLYVPFVTCNNGAGLVDVINDPTCTIYRSDDALVSYPNWTAFVAANPNTNIALNDYFAFIIADGSGTPGTWTISNVKVGKPGK